MKQQAFRIFVTVSFLALVVVASVYGQFPKAMAVNIPFKFIVSGTTFPAGEYVVERVWHINGGLMIHSADGHAAKIFLTRSFDGRSKTEEGLLAFNRYGDYYFLSQVWVHGDKARYELLPSRAERKLADRLAKQKQEMAFLKAHP